MFVVCGSAGVGEKVQILFPEVLFQTLNSFFRGDAVVIYDNPSEQIN
jgi:hypothetical protein